VSNASDRHQIFLHQLNTLNSSLFDESSLDSFSHLVLPMKNDSTGNFDFNATHGTLELLINNNLYCVVFCRIMEMTEDSSFEICSNSSNSSTMTKDLQNFVENNTMNKNGQFLELDLTCSGVLLNVLIYS